MIRVRRLAALALLAIAAGAPVAAQTPRARPTVTEGDFKIRDFKFDSGETFESSRDYNPQPDLEKIVCPLVAVNSADDQVNPPELGILEDQIKRVKKGRAVVIPISDKTRGHSTHSWPAIWGAELARLLSESGSTN